MALHVFKRMDLQRCVAQLIIIINSNIMVMALPLSQYCNIANYPIIVV